MRTELFWIEGPWQGQLAIMPRPRGGDWLEEEIQGWRRMGVDVVVSLLTSSEKTELDLDEEELLSRNNGIEFLSFSISDRSIPPSMSAFADLISGLRGLLAGGKNVAIHCRQGIGRAGMVAVCLLISSGVEQQVAIAKVSSARRIPVPETSDQRGWIANFTKSLETPRPRVVD